MINTDMRPYSYFTLGEEDEYGQATISSEPVGVVLMAIHITSQSVQDNINYLNCSYVGLTHANVDDTFVIDYEGEKLKVQYVNPKGKFKQAFLARM